MSRVPTWIAPRWRAAVALAALAIGVTAVGAFALPWLRADVPRGDALRVAEAEAAIALGAVVEERRCRFRFSRHPSEL